MYQSICCKFNRVLFLFLLCFTSLVFIGCKQGSLDNAPRLGSEESGVVVDAVSLAAANDLGGYASKVSVAQGESVDFHISTSIKGSYDLTIWREGLERTLMATISDLQGASYSCHNGYDSGCGWPVAASFSIPSSWPSGAYTADIPINGSTRKILFWVRENSPGSTSNILFLSSLNTELAYTAVGGKSLYPFNSSDGIKATQVSLDRPLRGNGSGQYLAWDGRFPIWAEEQGYTIEYAADYDLDFEPALLSHYDVLVIAGHSEYWTWAMRDRVRAFVENGGRFINLSGNTMWWQVRFEDNGRTMIAYKDYALDPETDPTLTTDNSWDFPILDTEYSLTGVHFLMGGYFPWGGLNYENGYGGYGVQKPGHWVFEGTDLQFNDVFGRTDDHKTAAIEHEVDGTTFNCGIGGQTTLGPLGNSGTPENFTILALGPAFHRKRMGFAAMGIYTNESGGATFSASSIGWAGALNDPEVSQIMINVLDMFSSSAAIPQEPKASSDSDYFFYDRFNCNRLNENDTYGPADEWTTMPAANYHEYLRIEDVRLTYDCGVAWTGMSLPINHDETTKLFAQVQPNWGDTDVLYSRLYINLSELIIENDNHFELFHHSFDPRLETQQIIGRVEIRKNEGQVEMRYRTDDGETEWASVPMDRPFLLETEYNNPQNRLSLWVNGQVFETAVSIPNNERINRVDIVLRRVDAGTNGRICIDEFAFDDQKIGDMALPVRDVELSLPQVPNIAPNTQYTTTIVVENNGNVADQFGLTAVSNNSNWSFEFEQETTTTLAPNESQSVQLTITAPADARADLETAVTITATSYPTKKGITHLTQSITAEPQHDFEISTSQQKTMLPNQEETIYQTITNQANYADSFQLSITTTNLNWSATMISQIVGPLQPGEQITIPITIQSSSTLINTSGTILIFSATSINTAQTATVEHNFTIGTKNIYLPLIKK